MPRGAVVTSARLELEGATGASANRAGMRILVADQDNMAPFTPGFPVLKDRYQWVDTSVDWYPTGSWTDGVRYSSPDFAALVQLVVSREGWYDGNYLCVMLEYAGSTGYQDYNNAKGSSDYAQEDLARLYIDYIIPSSDPPALEFEGDFTTLEFTTNSTQLIKADITMLVEMSRISDSLSESLTPGTSYAAENASHTTWTANVLVSPPPNMTDISFSLSYPHRHWGVLSIKDPLGVTKTTPEHWTNGNGVLAVHSISGSEYGIWKLQFEQDTSMMDVQTGKGGGALGATTSLTINEEIEVRAWTAWEDDERIEFSLIAPDDSIWYSTSNTTLGSSSHVLPSFKYRKVITIDHTQVAADLVEFPVLIDILDADLHNPAKVQSDGDDVLFVQNGVILAHEIEVFEQDYDATYAHLIAWVKANLSGSIDTPIEMYYGNQYVNSQENPEAIWSNGYTGVWHLDESPSGIADEIQDSTPNSNDGHTRGSMNDQDSVVAKVGYGLELDGTDDAIVIPESLSLDSLSDIATLETWINWANVSDGTYQRLMTTSNRFLEAPNTHHDGLEWAVNGAGNCFFYPWGGNSTNYNYVTAPFTNGIWHHVVVTMDYNSKEVILYMDGIPLTLLVELVPTGWTQLANLDDWIWGGNSPHVPEGSALATFDEIRVSSIVRSPQWIATEHANQDNPSGFYSIGSETPRPTSELSMRKIIDSSAPAGLWTIAAFHNTTGVLGGHLVSIIEREFIVRHDAAMTLSAPSDALGDGLSVRVVGDMIQVEVELRDSLSSDLITGADVLVNWTILGAPTQVTLNDYGTGTYGIALNTSDLETLGRWRVEVVSYDEYYNNATVYFDLDIQHEILIIPRTTSKTPYGDDFDFKIDIQDSFDATPVIGAVITSNGSILDVTDYNNGTYQILLDGSGYGIGSHYFQLNANPSESYLLGSSQIVCLDVEKIETILQSHGTDPADVPWGQDVNVTLGWYDTDHSLLGINGGTISGDSILAWTDLNNGNYSIRIDVSAYAPGLYLFNYSVSKANYCGASVRVWVNVIPHRTYIVVTYNSSVPVGADTYVTVTLHDLDMGGALIQGNFSQITAEWIEDNAVYGTMQFWIQTDTWMLGNHIVNLTLDTVSSPRFYFDAKTAIEIRIRKLQVSMTWEHVDTFPIGDDFEIFLQLNVSDPASQFHDDYIDGLTSAYFSAQDQSGTPYTIKTLTDLGMGIYSLTIDQLNFPGGSYTVRIFLTFSPAEDYRSIQTPIIAFTYRAARSYVSSPDYPEAITPYSSNISVTIIYEDIDRAQGIAGATIDAIGASIISVTYIGDGGYLVLLDTASWSIGLYGVDFTASAPDYESQNISISIRVRIIRTYAIGTVGTLDIPVGDSAFFYVDYIDMDHNVAIDFATGICNWTIAHYTIQWTGVRYKITINTFDTDVLGDYLLLFNLTKSANMEVGHFSIVVTIRTITTEFRLITLPEPTTPTGSIYISVYYGDRDHYTGIVSALIECTVFNDTGAVLRLWSNETSPGYYNITIEAFQFGGLGTQHLKVMFNWTGGIQKYHNMFLEVDARIIGEGSILSLIDAALPSPCLSNMSYTFLYASSSSGIGITNETGNVLVSVTFSGLIIDRSQIDVWETDRIGNPGYYSIRFNTTVLRKTGLFSMNVFINWSKGVSPYYTNRTDAISIRILPRETLLSVIPPTSVAYGENATFSFSYEDVTGGTSTTIGYNESVMSIQVSLSQFSLSYNPVSGEFTISFNTSQFGPPLGERTFTLDITWHGIPFYANHTGRTITMIVTARQTSLSYPTPPETPYSENATFTLHYLDVTGASTRGIFGATIVLKNESTVIPLAYHQVLDFGDGRYRIEIDTSYFSQPGYYSISVEVYSSTFYLQNKTGVRVLSITYRPTILISDPVNPVPFQESIRIILRYQDLVTLTSISNVTGARTYVSILNGTDWIFTCTWRDSFQDYLLVVETYNQGLDIHRPYLLSLNFSYEEQVPFYTWASIDISFKLTFRDTQTTLESAPSPAPYLDRVNFTVVYRDSVSLSGISGGEIIIHHGIIQLAELVDFTVDDLMNGQYLISIKTTSLGIPGAKSIEVTANWTAGSPFYGAAVLNVGLSVTGRPTNVEILLPPSQTQYLDNVTFQFAYVDIETGQAIAISTDEVAIYSGGVLLISSDYMIARLGTAFEASINSTVLSSNLVYKWNVTVLVNWNGTSPYYLDDRTAVLVTTSSRQGVVSPSQIIATPMGDNVTLNFAYNDRDTGAAISGAIIGFSCIERPALLEGIDYWILEGVGPERGIYTVHVDSNALGQTGQFTFLLSVSWNPGVSPYYANLTGIRMTGVVRLVYASVSYDLPSPSVVPYLEIVSFVLNFTDIDHAQPIGGAEAFITLEYKSTGLEPQSWNVVPLGGGLYNITANMSDLIAPGLQTFIIRIDYMPYQSLQFETPVQVRLRNAIVTGTIGPTNYAGYSTYALVTISDFDAGDRSLDGADLDIEWGDAVGWIGLGNGVYNITLDTTNLNYGTQSLNITATLDYYDIQTLRMSVILLSVPSDLAISWTGPRSYNPTEIYWGEMLEVYAAYNDTLRGVLIAGAQVTYSWVGGNGSFSGTLIPGNYTSFIDTIHGSTTGTMVLTVSARAPNYLLATEQIAFRLLPRPMDLAPEGGMYSFNVNQQSDKNITVFLEDTLSGILVDGATLHANWEFGSNISLVDVPGMPGYYWFTISTKLAETMSYQIIISASKQNYTSASLALTMTVTQILIELEPDALTSTYQYTSINWSQVVRIGVYVVVPEANITIPTCSVTWYSPELAANGTLVNGSSIGGPGYFYFDFDTSLTTATIHNFRITANAIGRNFTEAVYSLVLVIGNLPTTTLAPGYMSINWGWSGIINVTYQDLYNGVGIIDADSSFSWALGSGVLQHQGNGVYSIPVNTSLVRPGTYRISIGFSKLNYDDSESSITFRVEPAPTEAVIVASSYYFGDESGTLLHVPYGEALLVSILYNNTYLNRGIAGATIVTAHYSGPGFFERELEIQGTPLGTYSFNFDSNDWELLDQFVFTIALSLENRTSASLVFEIKIIEIPTGLEVIGSSVLSVLYNQEISIEVFYYDTWPGHDSEGIIDANLVVTGDIDSYLDITSVTPAGADGYYIITLVALSRPGTAELDVVVNRTNFQEQRIRFTISVSPSETDILVQNMLAYGPAFIIALALIGVFWRRVLKVPKMVRRISAMLRQLTRGKIPKTDKTIKSRHELVSELFNEMGDPIGLSRGIEGLAAEPIVIDIPVIEEMIIDLSILTDMTPEELEEFRQAVSKMKGSEQVSFAREVIAQEAVRIAQERNTTVEEVLEEVRQERISLIGGEVTDSRPLAQIYGISEPTEWAEVEKAPEARLTESELAEMRSQLIARGLPIHEVDSLIEQARQLPKDVGEMLLKGVGQAVDMHETKEDVAYLTDSEIEMLRVQLREEGAELQEIEKILDQARGVPRALAMELLEGFREDHEVKKKPEPPETMTEDELVALRGRLFIKGTPEEEIENIIEQAKKVPRDLVSEFLQEVEGLAPVDEDVVEFEDRLSEMDIEDLRKELKKRGLPEEEIKSILKQARNLPAALVDELLKSIDSEKK
ncbi:MAG: LamG-like jellyroll fold domain-containing protein [Promethearchaeota archaeon]